MTAPRIALCSLLLLIATAPLVAQGTYTQFDVPGSSYTLGFGINTAGDIVGGYGDASGNEMDSSLAAAPLPPSIILGVQLPT